MKTIRGNFLNFGIYILTVTFVCFVIGCSDIKFNKDMLAATSAECQFWGKTYGDGEKIYGFKDVVSADCVSGRSEFVCKDKQMSPSGSGGLFPFCTQDVCEAPKGGSVKTVSFVSNPSQWGDPKQTLDSSLSITSSKIDDKSLACQAFDTIKLIWVEAGDGSGDLRANTQCLCESKITCADPQIFNETTRQCEDVSPAKLDSPTMTPNVDPNLASTATPTVTPTVAPTVTPTRTPTPTQAPLRYSYQEIKKGWTYFIKAPCTVEMASGSPAGHYTASFTCGGTVLPPSSVPSSSFREGASCAVTSSLISGFTDLVVTRSARKTVITGPYSCTVRSATMNWHFLTDAGAPQPVAYSGCGTGGGSQLGSSGATELEQGVYQLFEDNAFRFVECSGPAYISISR